MARKQAMTREEAEGIAAGALNFLASEPERLVRFLQLSGLSPASLSASAGSPHMLQAVLMHLLGDESLLLVYASEARLNPEQIGAAERLIATYASGT